MVEAFHATLEEIFEADLVLLLVDASDPEGEIRRKVRLAARTLLPRVPPDAILPLLTKVDLLSEEALRAKAEVLADSEFHRPPLPLSVKTGQGLDALRHAIEEAFSYPFEVHLVLPLRPEGEAGLHWLHERADVLSAVHHPDRIDVVVRCRAQDLSMVESLGRVLLRRAVPTGPGLSP